MLVINKIVYSQCIYVRISCMLAGNLDILALARKYISDTVLFKSVFLMLGFWSSIICSFLFDQEYLKSFIGCSHICYPVLCMSSATHCSGSCTTMKLFTWCMPSMCLLSVYEWDYNGNKTGKMNLSVIIFQNPAIGAEVYKLSYNRNQVNKNISKHDILCECLVFSTVLRFWPSQLELM
jgi:hypothetical protein